EDIRECIGCNICYTGDSKHVPIRCTQNPTMGEEWRRGWHPEKIASKGDSNSVLIIGAGPTGLEAACALGKRGYTVMLAEATRELGGRVTAESKLPGLREWMRVVDYRVGQLSKLDNVEIYRESVMTLPDILSLEVEHVAIATGAKWRRDGYGNYLNSELSPVPPAGAVFTPDDIMAGRLPTGKTIVYDDDCFYMASVIAEKLTLDGLDVSYLTPSSKVSEWSDNNMEQSRVQARLLELDIDLILNKGLNGFDGHTASLGCVYTEQECYIDADSVVMVTSRLPNDELYHQLQHAIESGESGAPKSVARIGDAEGPSIIASAVYAGHKYARLLDAPEDVDMPAKIDRMHFH
ncbi:MAG: FAD-dependent oxidoreductase, partial [Pseudomonadales bacterium]